MEKELEQGKMEQKGAEIPNTFQLNNEELKNVSRLINTMASVKASGTMAEKVTAHVGIVCMIFEHMYKNGESKANLIRIARCIDDGIERFIVRLQKTGRKRK